MALRAGRRFQRFALNESPSEKEGKCLTPNIVAMSHNSPQ